MRTVTELMKTLTDEVEVIRQIVVANGEELQWMREQAFQKMLSFIRISKAFAEESPEGYDKFLKDEYEYQTSIAPKRCQECDGNNDCEGGCHDG